MGEQRVLSSGDRVLLKFKVAQQIKVTTPDGSMVRLNASIGQTIEIVCGQESGNLAIDLVDDLADDLIGLRE